MFNRRLSHVLIVSIAALVVVCVVVVAPAGAAKNKCQRFASKYRIMAQSPTSVVFQEAARDPARDPGFSVAYGCRFSQGRLRELPASSEQDAYGFQLAGRYVAYATNTAEEASPTTGATVYVVDLKTGKAAFAEGAYVVPPSPPDVEFSDSVDSIVLRANGSVAWITDASGSNNPQETLVVRRHGTSVTVLDRGFDVRLGSLALSRDGTTVFWMRGSTAKAAPMTARPG